MSFFKARWRAHTRVSNVIECDKRKSSEGTIKRIAYRRRSPPVSILLIVLRGAAADHRSELQKSSRRAEVGRASRSLRFARSFKRARGSPAFLSRPFPRFFSRSYVSPPTWPTYRIDSNLGIRV